jgi:ABC-type nickel/cobalt efflux system permease component RcnA
MVRLWGTVSFEVASFAFIVFTVGFFATVRWWTDALGRSIAGVVGSSAVILVVSLCYTLGVPIPGILWVRAVMYSSFALTMSIAVTVFFWSQFIAPRVHERRSRRSAKHQRAAEASRSGS